MNLNFTGIKSADGLQYECAQCSLKREALQREKCREQKILNYSQRTRQRLRLEIFTALRRGKTRMCLLWRILY
jgi:hypothetical protein